MIVKELSPCPEQRARFTLKFRRFVPPSAGCYVLATFTDEVLYLGLTDDLHRRFREHREAKEKCAVTVLGAAFWFYFFPSEPAEVARVERTWMNQHLEAHGRLPILNKMYSPVS